jgi:hypothetical protein
VKASLNYQVFITFVRRLPDEKDGSIPGGKDAVRRGSARSSRGAPGASLPDRCPRPLASRLEEDPTWMFGSPRAVKGQNKLPGDAVTMGGREGGAIFSKAEARIAMAIG